MFWICFKTHPLSSPPVLHFFCAFVSYFFCLYSVTISLLFITFIIYAFNFIIYDIFSIVAFHLVPLSLVSSLSLSSMSSSFPFSFILTVYLLSRTCLVLTWLLPLPISLFVLFLSSFVFFFLFCLSNFFHSVHYLQKDFKFFQQLVILLLIQVSLLWYSFSFFFFKSSHLKRKFWSNLVFARWKCFCQKLHLCGIIQLAPPGFRNCYQFDQFPFFQLFVSCIPSNSCPVICLVKGFWNKTSCVVESSFE